MLTYFVFRFILGANVNIVNLLVAIENWKGENTTGCGTYAGRAGAQKVFISQVSTSNIQIARLPINRTKTMNH